MISLNDVLLAASNIPVDDPIAEIWGRGLQGGYKIIKYTGSLPITINADGNVLIDYRIYGADGGVGEPTENLFDINSLYSTVIVQGQTFTKPASAYFFDVFSGLSGGSAPMNLQKSIPVTSGTYTLSFEESETKIAVTFSDGETQTIIANSSSVTPRTFDVSSDGYISIRCENPNVCSVKKLQIVKASTAPTSYIPYGYKLPMTVYDGETTQTVPIYIGENQLDGVEGVSDYVDKASGKIVRMIGEYTFTGEENFGTYGVLATFTVAPQGLSIGNQVTCRCSHFTATINVPLSVWSNSGQDKTCGFRSDYSTIVFRNTEEFVGGDEAKTYFKNQYDNGTPVKIWYIMETPIEEDPPAPLPEIPTIKGETIIDYDGTPKPSQMYVKYKDKG